MENNNLANWITVFMVISHWITCCCQATEGKFTNQRFIIAVLLPVHDVEYTNYDENILRKGKINDDMIEMAEAAFYAKDLIDKNGKLLPRNVTLDIVIKDYTDFPRFGVNQTDSKFFEELCWFGDWIKVKGNLPCYENGSTSHLIGIIYTENAVNELRFQSILQSFPLVPRISFSGPPKGILTDENLRAERGGASRTFNTVSSGSMFVIDVAFELLKHNNWTYVALQYTAFTSDRYHMSEGVQYMKRFQDLAVDYEICIAHIMDTESLGSIIESNRTLWEVVPSYNTVQVVICICTKYDLLDLQIALSDPRGNKNYVIIAIKIEDSIAPFNFSSVYWRPDLVQMNIILPKWTVLKTFEDYFLEKTTQKFQRDPWYREFWDTMRANNCQFLSERPFYPDTTCVVLFEHYSGIPNMMKSVYALAMSLNSTLNDDDWQEYPKFWIKMSNYINKINFTIYGDEVSFTQDGLPRTEKFEIGSWDSSRKYEKVGEYERTGYYYNLNQQTEKDLHSFLFYKRTLRINGTLRMNDAITNFPPDIKSTCSDPCPPGHAKIKQNDTCCWKCQPCDLTEILNDPTECTKCYHGYMSNQNKTACIPIPIRKSKWTDLNGLISTSFSLLCITLTAFTSGVFIKYRDTPAVKSTTRELCHVMFGGMILANVTPFVSIISFDAITCGIIRFIPAISFTMIYAALLVKTNRIARLLAMSKKKFPNLHPKFMSLRAQIAITFILIGIEILISSISIYFHPPQAIIDYKEEDSTWFGVETCNLDENILIETFVFIVILVVLCTNYAIKTRNLPENFNEAKYIGFAMYATILTGMAFALVYFNSEKKMLAINLCVSINSSVILIFLFAPKLYLILRKPEKNTKGNFVITTDMRSYQGNEKRSHSKQQHSDDHQLKILERKAIHAKSLEDRVQRSITAAVKELSRVINEDEQESKITDKNETENKQNVNNSQKINTQMIEKLKLCHSELKHIQKEVAKQKEKIDGYDNASFVNSE